MQRFTMGLTPPSVLAQAVGTTRFTMDLGRSDQEPFLAAFNQGIDSHLQGCTDTKHEWRGHKLHVDMSPADLLVVLRRLGEMDTEAAWSLRSSILSCYDIEEV